MRPLPSADQPPLHLAHPPRRGFALHRADRGLFVRERSDGLYTTVTYLLAKTAEELLLAFVTSIPVCLCVYYAIGLAGSFLTFWLSYYVTLCNGIAIAYLVRLHAARCAPATAQLTVWAQI